MGKTLSFAERLNTATVGQIAIEGMQFYAHHGFYKEEQVIGGQYEVDVYMNTDIEGAATTDRLEMTVNYERVYGIVKQVMTEQSKLIEHVAHRIIEQLHADFDLVDFIRVRVSKMHPPLKGTVQRVFVELSSHEVNMGSGNS